MENGGVKRWKCRHWYNDGLLTEREFFAAIMDTVKPGFWAKWNGVLIARTDAALAKGGK